MVINLHSAFIAKHYGGNYTGAGSDLKDPLSTVTAVDHNSLVTAFIERQIKSSTGHEIEKPLGTVTTVDKSRLVTAKDRFGLVTIHGQDYQIVDIGMICSNSVR